MNPLVQQIVSHSSTYVVDWLFGWISRPKRSAREQRIADLMVKLEETDRATPPAQVLEAVPAEAAFSGTSQLSAEGKACIPCLLPGNLVLINPSIKEIEKVAVGDAVLDMDGLYSIVMEIMERPYAGEIIAAKVPYQNESILLTPEHPVLALKAHGCRAMTARGAICYPGKDNPRCQGCEKLRTYKPEWVAAGDLSTTGIRNHWIKHIVLMPRLTQTIDTQQIHVGRESAIGYEEVDNTWIRPKKPDGKNRSRSAIKVRQLVQTDSNFLKLIGLYLAEGSVSAQRRGAQLRLDFGKHELVLANETRRLIQKVFGVDTQIMEQPTALRVIVCSSLVASFFKNTFGSGAANKKIPHWVLLLPLAKEASLVSGYWLGDGCKSYTGRNPTSPTFTASTASRQLAYAMRIILHRLGIIHNLARYKGSPSVIAARKIKAREPKFVLRVSGPSAVKLAKWIGEDLRPWRFLQSHLAGIDERWIYLPIKQIERIPYNGSVFNLKTYPTNTYTANGIIVHNCGSDHFSTVAGQLGEALRFAREGGVGHPECLSRIAHAEDELNVFEREDGAPEKVAKLPPQEKALMDGMLVSSRRLRHTVGAVQELADLERAAALAQETRRQVRTRLFQMQLGRLTETERQTVRERAERMLDERLEAPPVEEA